MTQPFRKMTIIGTAVAFSALCPPLVARAQDADRINSIQQQINTLQQELKRMRQDAARRDAALRQAQEEAAQARQQASQSMTVAPPAGTAAAGATTAIASPVAVATPPGPPGEFHTGGVTIKPGGFIEAAGIYRSRNEASDISSSFSGIPLQNTAGYHENELRGTARQSRVSLLVTGKPDLVTSISGYGEVDFQAAAPTANSNESNSYNPRIRQLYATYDRSDWGVNILAGQAWSLLTLDAQGISPRSEQPPLSIDAQYVPGFTWARQPQARVVKTMLDNTVSVGFSVESPQTTYTTSGYTSATNGLTLPNNGGFVNINNPGVSGFAPTVNYSNNVAPDFVLKAAFDPGYGHYEAYGVARFLSDRTDNVGSGHNSTVTAGGGGAAALVPVVPGLVDFRASFLAGYGIGRYGSGQLSDATIKPDGSPAPIPEVQALIGLVGHPMKDIDVYTYVGTEQAGKVDYTAGGKGYGYGSPLFTNTGCSTELSPLTCTGNTKSLTQGTVGYWWRFLHGDFGMMEVGAQYSYTKRNIFEGVGGSPSTDDHMVFLSFRYFPFN